jgi:SAM-dependent methyltransferase
VEDRQPDAWASGVSYDAYIGRWSGLVARDFLAWLAVPPAGRWLDVGCGTGVVARTILEQAEPASVEGVDPSQGFLDRARERIDDGRCRFRLGDAQELPFEDGSFDATVSGLVLNFVADPGRAASEMSRVTASQGVVAAYVWDYAGGMQLLRAFWDAAAELDPSARELDEGRRFPLARTDALERTWSEAGLHDVRTRTLDIQTVFDDLDDYWTPFLGGQGPAGAYAASLDAERQAALRERLRARLPVAEDGSISLLARALAVRGRR